jgi:hypothetical protein
MQAMKLFVAVLALTTAACVNVPKDNFAARAAECGIIFGSVVLSRSEEMHALANYPQNTGLGAGGACAMNGSTWRQVNAAQAQQRLNVNQPSGEKPAS